jgi:hypothetical protein
MSRQVAIGALALGLMARCQAIEGDRHWCLPPQPHFLARLHPVGGWDPDGGGLFHWWNPHCFPCCGGPDDYCRKPPPPVCRPLYPPYYFWGPPPIQHR